MARTTPPTFCALAWLCAAATTVPLSACGDDGGSSSADSGTASGTATDTGTATMGDDDPPQPDTGSTDTAPPPTTTCGDGEVEGDEECDDGNESDDDGCSSECIAEAGWDCSIGSPTTCQSICGDGMTVGDEPCDDGNDDDTDACLSDCVAASCGDSIQWVDQEQCDDGNADEGDGCSDTCEIEPGNVCSGRPSECMPVVLMADGSLGDPGNLFAYSLDGAIDIDLGPLDVALTAMAFHPDGRLFAVTATADSGPSVLGVLDPLTVTFTPIGPITDPDGTEHRGMPDITFIGDTLLGWTENTDSLGVIDTNTAEFITTPTQQMAYGTGIAYDSSSDAIWLAPAGATGTLYQVNQVGNVIVGPTLGGSGDAVKALSSREGILYGLDTNNGGVGGGSLVTYSPQTGTRTVLAPVPTDQLDALAVFDPDNVER